MTDTNSLRAGAGYALETGLYATYRAMTEAADTIDTLRAQLAEAQRDATAPEATHTAGNWISAADVDRLTRELDVAMNGKSAAASQASLCDVVAQAKAEAKKLGRPLLEAAQPPTMPPELVAVPVGFVHGFSTLAHNYSLRAVPPDYYRGTEGDAFSDAYRRCGQQLARLAEILTAAAKGESNA